MRRTKNQWLFKNYRSTIVLLFILSLNVFFVSDLLGQRRSRKKASEKVQYSLIAQYGSLQYFTLDNRISQLKIGWATEKNKNYAEYTFSFSAKKEPLASDLERKILYLGMDHYRSLFSTEYSMLKMNVGIFGSLFYLRNGQESLNSDWKLIFKTFGLNMGPRIVAGISLSSRFSVFGSFQIGAIRIRREYLTIQNAAFQGGDLTTGSNRSDLDVKNTFFGVGLKIDI